MVQRRAMLTMADWY